MKSVKLAERFPWHPKVVGLSDRAFRMYVSGLCYCATHGTDGELAAGALKFIGARLKEENELVDAGLWDRDFDGSVVIHDYLDYQPSRTKVETRREGVAERVRSHRAHRKRNAHVTALQGDDGSACNAVTTPPCNAVTEALHATDPSSPPHTPPLLSTSGSSPDLDLSSGFVSERYSSLRCSAEDLTGIPRVSEKPAKSRRWTRVPVGFEPGADHVKIASERGVDLAAELAAFRDHEFARPKTDPAATFRNWLRKASPARNGGRNQSVTRFPNRAEVSVANALSVLRKYEAEESGQ